MIVSAAVAVSENGIIGRKGDLPWSLPDDMKFFQRTTMGHHVITGRKNWETIPLKYRPLQGRPNIVVTRDARYNAPGAVVVTSVAEALALRPTMRAKRNLSIIIGGGEIQQGSPAVTTFDRPTSPVCTRTSKAIRSSPRSM
ncbi:MAG: dihydrofolate reductase [Flavobacteriales bacterium]|nr:dihydrofolate reductase [Flavobacteriales bacterium]